MGQKRMKIEANPESSNLTKLECHCDSSTAHSRHCVIYCGVAKCEIKEEPEFNQTELRQEDEGRMSPNIMANSESTEDPFDEKVTKDTSSCNTYMEESQTRPSNQLEMAEGRSDRLNFNAESLSSSADEVKGTTINVKQEVPGDDCFISDGIVHTTIKTETNQDVAPDEEVVNKPHSMDVQKPLKKMDPLARSKVNSKHSIGSEGNAHCRREFSEDNTDPEKPFSCEFCSYTTASSGTLKKHIKAHKEKKAFLCEFCPYKTIHSGTIKKHIRTHTGEKPFSCEYCSYKATEIGNLNRHILTHTRVKPFLCEFCSYKANEMGNLKLHLQTHTGEKPFSCEYCPYKTVHRATLKTHIRIHTGEKPFACEFCSYKANEMGSLKVHILTHTGEKPFPCELCSYKGRTLSTLKEHMVTHSKEKPFSCSECPYKTKQSAGLKRHMKLHTGEKSLTYKFRPYNKVNVGRNIY